MNWLILIGTATVATEILFGILATATAEDKDQADWVKLLDEKSFKDWKVSPGKADWKVVNEASAKRVETSDPKNDGKWSFMDGVLHGEGGVSHIFSPRGDYENFAYKAEIKISDKGNSGQYFRTTFGPSFPKGYEAQINSTHGDSIRSGSLYPSFSSKLSAEDRAKIIVKDRLVEADTWFTQEVTAVGNHITIKVNGKTTVDFVDTNSTFTKGHFAFQQHNLGSEVWIKNVMVKELPAAKKE